MIRFIRVGDAIFEYNKDAGGYFPAEILDAEEFDLTSEQEQLLKQGEGDVCAQRSAKGLINYKTSLDFARALNKDPDQFAIGAEINGLSESSWLNIYFNVGVFLLGRFNGYRLLLTSKEDDSHSLLDMVKSPLAVSRDFIDYRKNPEKYRASKIFEAPLLLTNVPRLNHTLKSMIPLVAFLPSDMALPYLSLAKSRQDQLYHWITLWEALRQEMVKRGEDTQVLKEMIEVGEK